MDGAICISKGHKETSRRYRYRADIGGHVKLYSILSMRDMVFHGTTYLIELAIAIWIEHINDIH